MQPSAGTLQVPKLAMECPDGKLQARAIFGVRHPWCSDTDWSFIRHQEGSRKVLELYETLERAKESSAAPHGLP